MLRSLKTSLILSAGLMFAATLAVAQSVEEGIEAAKNGDFSEAQSIWRDAASDGDIVAMRQLGGLHLSGVLGVADLEKAREWFLKSAEGGDAGSNLSLGYIYERGMGVPADTALAETYFARAAEGGSIDGLFKRATLVLARNADQAEVQKAVEDIRTAADQGQPEALATIGDFLRSGTFTAMDPVKAIEYFKQAAQNGHTQSLNTIGDMYLFAEKGAADIPSALVWYERAAAKGQTDAAYSVAYLLYNLPGASDADLRKAFDYASMAALAWNEQAQWLLGQMYLEDIVVPRNDYEAYRWLDLAASAGVIEAHHLRAMAEVALGPEQAAKAHEEAQLWFDQNHGQPHVHRLINNNVHTFGN